MKNYETPAPAGAYLPGWDWRTSYDEIPLNGEETLRAAETLATVTADELAQAQGIADEVWRDRGQRPHRFYLVVNNDTGNHKGELLDQPELAVAWEKAFPNAKKVPVRVYNDLPEKVAHAAAYLIQYRESDTILSRKK